MEVTFNKMNQDDFNKMDTEIIFSDNFSNKCYGVLSGGIFKYRISWYSDLVEPKITCINNEKYGIGIDQKYMIIDFQTGDIILDLDLDYNFIEIQMFPNSFFIITELEVFEFDRSAFIALNEYNLPDFFIDIEIKEEYKLIIHCADGSIVEVNSYR